MFSLGGGGAFCFLAGRGAFDLSDWMISQCQQVENGRKAVMQPLVSQFGSYLVAMLVFKLSLLVMKPVMLASAIMAWLPILDRAIISGHPFLCVGVELELGAVVAHGNELVVELRERDAIVAIELLRIDREGRFHGGGQLERGRAASIRLKESREWLLQRV